jgi:GDPmannose 4,6-dehydratase
MKTVIVSGATGQIGSYAVERFLQEGFKVYGLRRRSSSINTQRLDHLYNNPNLEMVYGDLTDFASIGSLVNEIKPDLFVNCGALSYVSLSFIMPCNMMQNTGDSVINCLEAIRKYSPKTKFITMSSSEMYGSTPGPQNELSPFSPRSIYAVSKICGYYATKHYRDLGIFASNLIAFNSESPRRGIQFLPKKTTLAAARIKLGLQDKLLVGNLSAKRDWSHASDTVDALYKIIMDDEPDDYCVGSGQSYSVEFFVEQAFKKLDLDWKEYVSVDPKYYRPTEVDHLQCDASKIKSKLNWIPKYNIHQIIDEMIAYDLELARKEKLLLDAK